MSNPNQPPFPSTSTSRNYSDRRAQVQNGRDALLGINERLQRTETICRESEVVATETLGELANQRETLTRTRDRLNDADRELGSANRNLKSIHRRLATNKLLLTIIVIMELIIIGCQLYIKFLK